MAYKWDGRPALSITVNNSDTVTYDSLQMRVYFNATTAEMGISGKEDDTTYQFCVIR